MTRSENVGCGWGLSALMALSCGTLTHGVEIVGCEVDKIIASDADELDGFSEHLFARGDVAIVGAWNDEDNVQKIGGFAFGSAYILRRLDGAWTEEQKLLPSDPEIELRFGHDVAIHGDRAIVGARLGRVHGRRLLLSLQRERVG